MEIVADFACQTGECPVWHPLENALYWSDIPRGKMYRYDPAFLRSEEVFSGDQLGALIVQDDGSILQFLEEGRVQIWRNGAIEIVSEHIAGEEGTRFNDAVADARGRALAGTMPSPNGKARLFRFDLDGRATVLLDDVGQANGIAFGSDGSKLYFTDTKRGTITCYDYDLERGELSNPHVVVTVEEEDSVPDGLALNAEGDLLSARWGGGCFVRYSVEGIEIERIQVPARQVSSLAFGGSDFRDLYITTAGGHERDQRGPSAGALFRTRVDQPGCHAYLSQIRL